MPKDRRLSHEERADIATELRVELERLYKRARIAGLHRLSARLHAAIEAAKRAVFEQEAQARGT